MKPQTTSLLLAALALAGSSVTQATPYATALTNTGSRISFRLNESADAVKLIYNGGASELNLGALRAGLFSTNVVITGAFKVEAFKAAGLGYLYGVSNSVSFDTNQFVRFNSPRGVAVNRNPASPYFGRVYVGNSDAGTISGRAVGDGIYLLNADLSDAVGQGNVARTAGLVFTNAETANKPFRLEVGADDQLYISDYGTTNGNLLVADPNVSPGSGTNVFEYNPARAGRIPSSAIVRGSLAGGDLSVTAVYPDLNYEYDFFGFPATSYSVVQRWDIGDGPLPSAASPVRVTDLPILIADVPAVLSDIDIAPDGKLYVAQNRSAGLEAGLVVVDPNSDVDGSGYADIVFNSLGSSQFYFGSETDLLFQTRAVKVSPDGRTVALVRDDSRAWIIQVNDGLPDLASRRLLNSGNVTLGRDITFDAAGNLYIVSSGEGGMRVFSPGYPTRATTGSDGTFEVIRYEGQTVTLTMGNTNATEAGTPGSFTLTRTGSTAEPLTVGVSFAGTASYNADFNLVTTNIVLGAGVATATVSVNPLNDIFGEPTETIVVSIVSRTNYFVKGAFTGTIFLSDDNDPPTVSISGLDTNLYERLPVDAGRFSLTRQAANISNPMTVLLGYGGTAVGGVDYLAAPESVTFPAGVAVVTNALVSIDNILLDGPRVITVTVLAGDGYTANPSAQTAAFTIRDDEVPDAPELFSDNFDDDTSGAYTVRFGADNGIDDKTVDFAWNYGAAGIPSAPHSAGGTTRGLRLSVNKRDATASIAGVNVYPKDVSFSNDFALRFDMFLTFNAAAAGTTEHATFGVLHSGNQTNRHNTAGNDGVWLAVETDGSSSGGGRSYTRYTPTNTTSTVPFTALTATTFASFFTVPPFLGNGAASGQWVDGEVSQTNNIIVWKLNAVPIAVFTNAGPSRAGTIMLGYMDTFASIGSTNNYVIFDNVRVVNLDSTPTAPVITAVRKSGGSLEIDFTAGAGDDEGQFTVESTVTLPGGFAPDAGAVVSALGGGKFRATSVNTGDHSRVYRIRR